MSQHYVQGLFLMLHFGLNLGLLRIQLPSTSHIHHCCGHTRVSYFIFRAFSELLERGGAYVNLIIFQLLCCRLTYYTKKKMCFIPLMQLLKNLESYTHTRTHILYIHIQFCIYTHTYIDILYIYIYSIEKVANVIIKTIQVGFKLINILILNIYIKLICISEADTNRNVCHSVIFSCQRKSLKKIFLHFSRAFLFFLHMK